MSAGAKKMVYVAVDPDRPGEAWAIMATDGAIPRKEIAGWLSEWVMQGANVERVALEVGQQMLGLYLDNRAIKRKVKQLRPAPQVSPTC
jgi:hypothetical protein